MKKLYCLIVGITQYNQTVYLEGGRVLFPTLYGSVEDCKKIIDFLESNFPKADLNIVSLFNKDATKENICNSFINHLSQAESNDSVLFYFSGHGTREEADICFKTETDGKLESLVCYYDNDNKDKAFIADKELRYLINKVALTGAHVTILTDCCHSGDVTRAPMVAKSYSESNGIIEGDTNAQKVIEKKSTGNFVFSMRPWNNFIFANEFTPEDIRKKGIEGCIPQGKHINLSAAQSNETALEVNGEGIFTKYLMVWLNRYNGFVSYQKLFNLLSLQMRYAYTQQPRIYAPEIFEEIRNSGFLNRELQLDKENSIISYNNGKKKWILNKGILGGITSGLEIELKGKTKSQVIAKVISTNMDDCEVDLSQNVDQAEVFPVNLEHLTKSILKIFPDISGVMLSEANVVMDLLLTGFSENLVSMVGEEDKADFVLRAINGNYFITKSGDNWRPLSAVIAFSHFENIIRELQTLASWKFCYNLSYPSDKQEILPVELLFTINKNQSQKLNEIENSCEIKITDWNLSEEFPTAYIAVKVKNIGTKPIFIAALYLDINFYVHTFLLEGAPYLLEPGNSVDLNVDGNTLLPFDFYKPYLYYNWKWYSERIKIIYSERVFEINNFKLEGISEPPLPGKSSLRGNLMGVERSAREESMKKRVFSNAGILNIDIKACNPLFNKIPFEQIDLMLKDPITNPFAGGLFFQNDSNLLRNPFSVDWIFKDEIKLLKTKSDNRDGAKNKGLIMDVANWWSRKKRNNYYEEICKRFPERIKIVSEGDSWFEHPLVIDTIDHLSKIYAIRCVAAAGDTLKNYFSNEHKRGDYFLDIIEETKPRFFLISGGGNDILGEQFSGFLIDNPYTKNLKTSKDWSKFFKRTLDIQLDALMAIYTQIFDLLQSKYPTMITFVHGYDYPVKLDEKNKWWLGRYMIEKGITEALDRRGIIKYLLDEFNNRLSQVASKFPKTVVYIDLRGTVNYIEGELDQWYDEIHPNSDGFQLIALKFVEAIEKISKPSFTK